MGERDHAPDQPAEIEPIVRQSSLGGVFDIASALPTGGHVTQQSQKVQRVEAADVPAVLHLKSLLGPTIPIPASSVQSVADLQAIAVGVYGIQPFQQRLFFGSAELSPTTIIADLPRLSAAMTHGDSSIRILLSLPTSCDSDVAMGALRCLPAEIIVSILSLLPVPDVCAVSRTCKRLREVASDCKLWWTLYSRYWCPYSGTNNCTWKETYKSKLESFAVRSCEEQRVRECIKQLFERQSKVALAMSPQSRASPMNLGLLDDCSRRAIQFGAPAYNRRDFDACYRMYFSLVRHIVSNYGDFPRATPLFRKAINYLRNSLAMAKNAQDDSRRAWSLRHGLDSIMLMVSSHRTTTKALLNLGEEYCARHMWAEAEASINEALDMSFESLPVSEVSNVCDNLACHNYIFFMYIHALLMQGKYVPIIIALKEAMHRGSLSRLKLASFRHTVHFVEKGISAIDACLSCPHITTCDTTKLLTIRLYYIYAAAPTAEQLNQARQFCAQMRRLSVLPCLNSLISFLSDKLEYVQPLPPNVCAHMAATGVGGDDDSGDEEDNVV